MKETELYQPIKEFLESQGYDVKGEISDCDVVAVRDGDDPVIVELKTGFTLPLVFQGVRRQSLSDTVYLAVPARTTKGKSVWGGRYKDIKRLCRVLGLGLLTVTFKKKGAVVEVHLDPTPYQPRKNKRRQGRMLREHQRRVGDTATGGSTRTPIMTAYRQDALRCADFLAKNGAAKAADIREATSVERARDIVYRDVYGWFERVERGVYDLTLLGHQAVTDFSDALDKLSSAAE